MHEWHGGGVEVVVREGTGGGGGDWGGGWMVVRGRGWLVYDAIPHKHS